jgi:rsbT co-antagonist protein RsbR
MASAQSRIPAILKKYQKEIDADWMKNHADSLGKDARLGESELKAQMQEFMELLQKSPIAAANIEDEQWAPMREFLEGISRSRALQGFSADQTATFIFSFKRPLFARLRQEVGKDAQALADETWNATAVLDRLGLHTFNAFQKAREQIIARQQTEILELSTPVVKLWDGILALPMIGTLDSARTQVVMESLLHRIVETGSETAIIDITGVPTVDTLTAQHLMRTVTAIRMMGADCIISGIRPQIAQTIVHLGIDLQGVTTKATLADALAVGLKRAGFVVTRRT